MERVQLFFMVNGERLGVPVGAEGYLLAIILDFSPLLPRAMSKTSPSMQLLSDVTPLYHRICMFYIVLANNTYLT